MDSPKSNQKATSTEHRKRIIDRKKENNSELMLFYSMPSPFLFCRRGLGKGNILVYCNVIRVGDDLKPYGPPIESQCSPTVAF